MVDTGYLGPVWVNYDDGEKRPGWVVLWDDHFAHVEMMDVEDEGLEPNFPDELTVRK